MKKKNPRRSGKNVSDGRKVKKTNGQSKRRMGSLKDEWAVEKTNEPSKDEWAV